MLIIRNGGEIVEEKKTPESKPEEDMNKSNSTDADGHEVTVEQS